MYKYVPIYNIYIHIYILLNSGPALAPAKSDVALTSLFSLSVCWSGVTLYSSVLKQATDSVYTVLKRGQIAHEDPTIKNSYFNKLIIN